MNMFYGSSIPYAGSYGRIPMPSSVGGGGGDGGGYFGSRGYKDDSDSDCSICLQPLAIRTMVKLICGHQFHLDCIGSIFNEKNMMECPVCRTVDQGQWLNANDPPPPPFDFELDGYLEEPDFETLVPYLGGLNLGSSNNVPEMNYSTSATSSFASFSPLVPPQMNHSTSGRRWEPAWFPSYEEAMLRQGHPGESYYGGGRYGDDIMRSSEDEDEGESSNSRGGRPHGKSPF